MYDKLPLWRGGGIGNINFQKTEYLYVGQNETNMKKDFTQIKIHKFLYVVYFIDYRDTGNRNMKI